MSMNAARDVWVEEANYPIFEFNEPAQTSLVHRGKLPVAEVVFLLDVDNTLLDSDQFAADFRTHLEREFGSASADRFWTIFTRLRGELGYVDYLGALQLFRLEAGRRRSDNPRLLQVSSFLIDYPFADLVYPRVFDVIERLSAYGPTVILSDGDVVLQPRKIQRSGLWDAVSGRVLIYVHKEQMLDVMQRHYPARHYVMVDDKPRVLSAMKAILKGKLTSVLPRQGHYALDANSVASYPPADLSIERIGDLADFDIRALFEARTQSASTAALCETR
jgi:FMN phosphatase YigB (HAD superfamily)